jgi:hypothetical protein
MLNSPIIRFLLTLKHAAKTDLSAGFINNMDAVALFIYTNGETDMKALKEFSNAWRDSDVLKYCFGPHNGCIATDFNGQKIYCDSFGPCSGAPAPGKQLWYRLPVAVTPGSARKRLLHKLTRRGEERCTQLLEQAAL